MDKSCENLSESGSSKRHQDKKFRESEAKKEITITVESIENVDENKVREVMVMVDFLGNVLNQSYQTPISKSRADIDLTSVITVEDNSPQFMNEILANPVLFTVFDCTTPSSVLTATGIPSPNSEVKKKMSKTSTTPLSISKSFMHNTVLGICNLDIGSLVMGEKRIKETLVVESEKKLTPLEKINWNKLPRLVVVASTGAEPLTSKATITLNNVIGITIESIYNIPEYISEGSVFDAFIQVPTIGDKNCRIKFPNGLATSTKDFSCRKKWVNLSDIEGPGGKSKYRILPDTCDVISGPPGKEIIDPDGFEQLGPEKTIRWDMWRNCLMLKDDINYFYQKLVKYRVWPIEIILPNKSKEQIQKEKSSKSDKKSKPVPSATTTNGDHFTAFLYLAPLLHPGETRIRVAAQLMTYSQVDLVNNFGAEFSSLQIQASMGTVKGRTMSERSKASIREPEEVKDSPGLPVVGPNGHPTFIVVEVELFKPLSQKKDPESVKESLKDTLSIKGKIKKKSTNLDMVLDSFSQSIKDVVSTIKKEYQTYSLSYCSNDELVPDDPRFYEYFCKRKNFYRIRTTLEERIVDLINEKYGMDKLEEKIPAIYIDVVNEMHKVTNSYKTEQDGPTFCNTSELQLYSEEAIEEGDYTLAKQYLFLKLSKNTSNPNYWLDIAAYCIRVHAMEWAIQAVREALCLDFHHQIGLLMYALLMAQVPVAEVGEMAFQVLLTEYPDYAEGWMLLGLFYNTFGNSEGAITAYKQARVISCERLRTNEKETEKKGPEIKQVGFRLKEYHNDKYKPAPEEKYGIGSFKDGMSWSEPLSWTTTLCPPDNVRLRAVLLLLKLGFYQYASLCLSAEMLSGEKHELSPPLVYYTCVNYYLQRRYEDAITLLQKYVKEYAKDCFIWSLLGHCYFSLHNHAKAIACYEYVIESFNRPDDIHLVNSRMGLYYIEANKYPCAKQTLVTACKYSPTPRLWKGVGISCLMLQELDDAETAFTEANYLDNRDAETWAYLAITNALLRRLDIFKQCYLEARKRGLQNAELIKKIKCFARVNGLTDKEFNI